jgi:hypothetical protein
MSETIKKIIKISLMFKQGHIFTDKTVLYLELLLLRHVKQCKYPLAYTVAGKLKNT